MVAGYLLIGVVAGLVTFISALFLGTSLLLAVALYTLVGTATVIVLAVLALLFGNSGDQAVDTTATDRRDRQNKRALRPALTGPEVART